MLLELLKVMVDAQQALTVGAMLAPQAELCEIEVLVSAAVLQGQLQHCVGLEQLQH